jgi:hypothetical protein
MNLGFKALNKSHNNFVQINTYFADEFLFRKVDRRCFTVIAFYVISKVQRRQEELKLNGAH